MEAVAQKTASPVSRRNRVLIGCALAVGVAALLLVATMFGLGIYVFGTPRQVPVASMVGPETVAIVRVRGNVDDPGVGALVQRFADGMTAVQTSGPGAPPSLSWMKPLLAFNNRQSMSYITPRELGIVMEPDAGGDTRAVFVVALHQLPRMHQWMFTWMLSRAAGTVPRRGGVPVLPLGPGAHAHLALTRGTVFISESQDALGAVLDRLAVPPPSSPVADRLATLGTTGDGEAVALVARDVPFVPDAPGCESLAATMDVVDANRIDVRLELACSEASEEEQRAILSQTWTALGGALPAGIGITPSSSAAGTASIFGVGTWIDGAFRGTGRPGPPPAPPPATPAPGAAPAAPDASGDSGENGAP